MNKARHIQIDGGKLRFEDIHSLSVRQCESRLSHEPEFVRRIDSGADFVNRLLREDGVIYGVTTGFGDSCTVQVAPGQAAELSRNLYLYHGCGLGRWLEPEVVRAVMATRLQSLCMGFSGVRYVLLEQIQALLSHDVLPLIPEEGSVGASGDLTPLSYLAAVLCGEREVWYRGERRETAAVFSEIGLRPLVLGAKEGLALMNGTAVMTAQACLAMVRADYLCRLATRLTAMAALVLRSNAHHFDATLFSVKPHPGQQEIARRLRADLLMDEPPRNEKRLQDRYSIRCAPHILGVLQDSMSWLRAMVENELNSANDNPIIDPIGQKVLHGGHFYGGHIAMAMDMLKTAVANIADMLDRQLALMVDARYNNGLPANLSGVNSASAPIHHGLKAVQIAVSAWTAEALKLTMPASVFSRSTECHNQDKVSMGSIAARDVLRVLELSEQVVAAMLIAVRQGLELRVRQGDIDRETLSPELDATLADLDTLVEFVADDRALDADLRCLLVHIRAMRWPLYG